MQRKVLTVLLASALGLFSPFRASASALGPDDVAAMIRAMLAMVRVWNALQGAEYGQPPRSWAVPPPSAPGMGPPPSAPWPWNSFSPPGSWTGRNYPFAVPEPWRITPMPGGANTASGSLSTPSLSGTWQGDNGDVLVIRGDRFRIYDGESFYNDGTFRIVGNQLLIYAPTSGIVRRYQFAYRGNQLALRDSAGQVLSFRRLDESFPRYKKRIIM